MCYRTWPVAFEERAATRLAERHLPQMSIFIQASSTAKARLPATCFNAIFAIARVAGAAGPWKEQLGANRITGPPRSIRQFRQKLGAPGCPKSRGWR